MFGISLRGFIFEVDIKTLSIINVSDTYGGSAWCAACTTITHEKEECSVIAIGCEDGGIKLFRYDVGGVLEYLKSYPSVGCRILSMAVNANLDNIYIGCSDGLIRIFNKNTGKQVNHITGNLTRGLNSYIWSLIVLSDNTIISGDNRGTVQVWDGTTCVLMQSIHQHTAEILSLAVSPDENNVYATGVDSRVICIRRINNAFGNTGMDPSPADSQWLYSSAHRPHSHDVYALAVCHTSVTSHSTSKSGVSEKNVVDAFMLLSGGIDTKLCLYSISEFHMTRPQWILPIPPTGIVHSSKEEQKTISIQHSSHIDIWKAKMVKPVVTISEEPTAKKARITEDNDEMNYYGSTPKKISDTPKKKNEKSAKKAKIQEEVNAIAEQCKTLPYGEDLSDNCSIVSKIVCSNGDFIYTSALSACGKFVSFSKAAHTRLYCIVKKDTAFALLPISLPESISNCLCYTIAFGTKDNEPQMACVTTRGSLFLLSIEVEIPSESNPSGFKVLTQNCVNHFSHVSNTLNYLMKQNTKQQVSNEHLQHPLLYTVNTLVIGENSNYIVVSDCTSYLYVYDINKRMKLHWAILPSMIVGSGSDLCITNIQYYDENKNVLAVLLSNNSLVFVDILDKKVLPTPWCDVTVGGTAINMGTSPSPSHGYIPNELLNLPSPLTGLTIVSSMMVLYGSGCIVVVNIPTNNNVAGSFKLIKSTANNEDNFSQYTRAMKQYKLQVEAQEKKSKKQAVTVPRPPTHLFSMITCYRSLVDVSACTAPDTGNAQLVS